MSILVDNKPIEVRLRYIDKPYRGGAVGTKIFNSIEEEKAWVKKEKQVVDSDYVVALEELDKLFPGPWDDKGEYR